jgi:hypothetical protein
MVKEQINLWLEEPAEYGFTDTEQPIEFIKALVGLIGKPASEIEWVTQDDEEFPEEWAKVSENEDGGWNIVQPFLIMEVRGWVMRVYKYEDWLVWGFDDPNMPVFYHMFR